PGKASNATTGRDGTPAASWRDATPSDRAGRSRHASHRGGQGFKSPQLHREFAGQRRFLSRCSSPWKHCWEPSNRLPVGLRPRAVATAKTVSTSTIASTLV